MNRQRSLLSFFQKSSSTNSDSGLGGNRGAPSLPIKGDKHSVPSAFTQPASLLANDSSAEVRGTDTPPEKVPRQILPSTFSSNDKSNGATPFSRIMHKFVRDEDGGKVTRRSLSSIDILTKTSPASGRCVNANLKEQSKQEGAFQPIIKDDVAISNKADQEDIIPVEHNEDIPRPETPGMQPLASRAKRCRDDGSKFSSLLDSSKRVKFLEDLTSLKRTKKEVDMVSKFEWLDPCRIRDANGRKPDDPLYDRTTLYIPPEVLKKMSASQKQYWSVKCKYMDVVLFFKVGKFYELYEMDAEIGHKELDWKMTLSGVGKCRQVGIPESGIDDAVQKLVARGYKVGRVEQLETSQEAKAKGVNSIIPRKLVQVVTPSTLVDNNIGPDAVHLLAIKEGSDLNNGSVQYGFAFVDCAALRFWVGSIDDDASCSALGALLLQVSPKEVIYESRGLSKEAQKAFKKYSLNGSTTLQLTPVQSLTDLISPEVTDLVRLNGYFKRSSDSLDHALSKVNHPETTMCALGGLINHLTRLMLEDVLQNGDIYPYQVYRGCLKMDGQTLINLEIFSNNADGGQSGTLYKYLDSCVTSSGKRVLRSWICHPLKDVDGINNRLDVVDGLVSCPEIVSLIAQHLHKLPDLERLLGRIKITLQSSGPLLLPMFRQKVLKRRVKVFGSLVKGLRTGLNLLLLLQNEGPLMSSFTKVFKVPVLTGSCGLDQFLSQFEAAIESDFPDYQNHEVTDADAETLATLIEVFMEKVAEWFEVVHAVNCIDVLRSFAVTSSMSCGTMCRPVIASSSKSTSQDFVGPVLKMKGLWHPFALGELGNLPVPNDINLGENTDVRHPHTLLLTGPNMGGKSTLLRATCLAVIMAQLGCYVPCENCDLSVVDIIFTRLGATDRIMTGESTFFIECTETAQVLQNATQDSLVILDELGRGTSTFDGYAIAYSVFRHLIEKVNCRLLFATHYHSLTKEFASHPHVMLQHMACAFESESDGHSKRRKELVFLYRLFAGACPESYGLQVALMAGIPEKIVNDASKASQRMKKSIGRSFWSSEQRSEFSTLHEEWLKTLVSISRIEDCLTFDEDAFDSLFCMWCELKTSLKSGN
ncbi:DNA mismatch repair protein MSH7-like [Prosopis cineraria]|uniref:DNA mismatch repair protein MSH7-like n=1 Tax=Prosopis cineraria TaxID=364024 RepID=UPI00240EB660|nr:DNA mismatch repair protein MSH7-like [Prosopis cineraria]